MVRIRLCRVGAKKQPSYRVVVADQRSPRDGRFIEIIGNYNPRTDPPTVVIKEERALYWLSQGAQPSDAIVRMLKNLGIMDKFLGIETEAESEPDATTVVEAEVPAEIETEVAADDAEVAADDAETGSESPDVPAANAESDE